MGAIMAGQGWTGRAEVNGRSRVKKGVVDRIFWKLMTIHGLSWPLLYTYFYHIRASNFQHIDGMVWGAFHVSLSSGLPFTSCDRSKTVYIVHLVSLFFLAFPPREWVILVGKELSAWFVQCWCSPSSSCLETLCSGNIRPGRGHGCGLASGPWEGLWKLFGRSLESVQNLKIWSKLHLVSSRVSPKFTFSRAWTVPGGFRLLWLLRSVAVVGALSGAVCSCFSSGSVGSAPVCDVWSFRPFVRYE